MDKFDFSNTEEYTLNLLLYLYKDFLPDEENVDANADRMFCENMRRAIREEIERRTSK